MFNHKNSLLAFPILSFVWFTGTIVLAGFFYPEYSHKAQFISELGATGSPHGNLVNYLGFIPTELFIFAFIYACFLVLPKTRKNMMGLTLIFVYGFTLGIAAIFPCDFECKSINPTISHNIHILSAFPGYLCGIISIFVIASNSHMWSKSASFKKFSYYIGIACMGAFLSLSINPEFVGIFQRGLEFMIYSWFIYFSYSLNRVTFPLNDHSNGNAPDK